MANLEPSRGPPEYTHGSAALAINDPPWIGRFATPPLLATLLVLPAMMRLLDISTATEVHK